MLQDAVDAGDRLINRLRLELQLAKRQCLNSPDLALSISAELESLSDAYCRANENFRREMMRSIKQVSKTEGLRSETK
jgi:hypothetical protein